MGMKKNDASKTAKSCTAELMAKRETNAEPHARPEERYLVLWVARGIAKAVRRAKENKECCALLGQLPCNYGEIHVPTVLRAVADILEAESGNRQYPSDGWYDSKILVAHERAIRDKMLRLKFSLPQPPEKFPGDETSQWQHFMKFINDLPWPTVSEVLSVFRRQNQGLKGVSDRSVRRALERLYCFTRRDKRGRPRKKIGH
jgi:hypothetical protein